MSTPVNYGPRTLQTVANIAARTWNDAREDLEQWIRDVVAFSDVANVVIQQFNISSSSSGTTVTGGGASDPTDAFFLMGA